MDLDKNKKIKKFYSCKYDLAFKEVFSKEENVDLLKLLLEHILKVSINNIAYLNVERNSDNIHVRRKQFDLFLNTNIGKIQVEVNSSVESYTYIRNTVYHCATYSHYTLRGEDYSEDTQIIQINFNYGIKDDKLVRIHKIQDDDLVQRVKNFYIYDINMDKYLDFWYTGNEKEIESNKLLIMLGLEKDDLSLLAKDDKEVKKYMDELVSVNENPEFFEYMSAEEDLRKQKNSLKKEGIEIGKEQGIKQGIEKTVKQMATSGIPLEQISEITGLSEEELNKII